MVTKSALMPPNYSITVSTPLLGSASASTIFWFDETEFVFQINRENNVAFLSFRNEEAVVVCLGIATAA